MPAPKDINKIKKWKENISIANKGRIFTNEWKEKIGKANKGKHLTNETKEKIRQKALGRKMPSRSKEYRDNVSKRHKGRIVSAETRKKISEWHKGKIISQETKDRMSKAHKGEGYSNSGQFVKGQVISGETRKKLSMVGKGRIPWNKGKKYKSPKQSLVTSGSNNPNWKGGISFEKYGQDWTDDLKDSIRKRDNYTCQECRILQDELDEFIKVLDVHHIDYNKYNLNPKNLITLCRSCHAKTSFNRDYWINYFNNK
jgi:hypothetical protein